MTDPDISDILGLTTEIVAAYVSHNKVEREDVSAVIEDVFKTMQLLSDPVRIRNNRPKPIPAIAVEDSVTDAFIYSLEDGQPYKSLKRHLKAKYGMSPEDYKEKWGLPIDYPMVSPAYARERSELAKKSGLGRSQDTAF